MPHCLATTADGGSCFNRVGKRGDRCALHRDHKRRTPQAIGPVHRCAAKTLDGNACFVRVAREGDACRVHARIAEEKR